MNINTMHKELEDVYPKMVEIRRDLHQHPEIGFEEERTPQVIADYLKSLGIEVRTEVGGRGVVGILRGKKEGKTVALRADFDALPIHDEKDVPYKSLIPGKMHACGHDGHTAALLGAATVLAKHRDELEGNVVFLHQFAEEVLPGGAKSMIEDGCLDGVDVVFGAHLQSVLPLGEVYCRPGYMSAAADVFEINLFGKGGHGAYPQMAIDPVVAASQLVVNLQQIVSRNVDPMKSGVLTVGSIQSGDAPNVIPNTARISGTIRTFEPEIRELIEKRIREMTEATCIASEVTSEIEFVRGYDPIWNHQKETDYIMDIAASVVGQENTKEATLKMTGEDFSYYVQEVPGAFFNVGARLSDPDLVFGHHHPRFDFDEKALLTTAKVFVSAVANINK